MIDKKTMWKIITVTVVALAAAILVTAVGGAVMLVGDMLPSGDTDKQSGEDTKAPVIKATTDPITISTVGTVSYRKYVTVTDNSGAECQTNVDSSKVDQTTPGEYSVTYTATDPSGNVGKLTVTVIVVDSAYTEDQLMTLVAQFAKRELGYTKEEARSSGYSKAKIVQDIYNYVKDPSSSADAANIEFNDRQSNDPNQYKQNGQKNRNGWKYDWIDEAYITLTMSDMEGDCYTYYAVSKAFFEYFGIDNVGIQRAENSKQSGTHYWHVVNIGTESSPKWYYYDSTRLAGKFSSDNTQNSCLITEAKLLSYLTRTGETEFYMVDKTNTDFFDAEDNGGVFPKIETTKLG